MKLLKRILVGVLLLLIILFLGVIFYLYTQKPVYQGELVLSGLKDDVEVLYDGYGVPHIYAMHAEDAYEALGYVHAQDRLFQMEMLRRAADGRLAEVLGSDLVKVDRLFRTLGLNKFAEEQAKKFLASDSLDFQKAALAYQRGINAYIENGKTPVEFTIMGIPATPFTPKDIYLAIGFMSFGFAEGLQADPVLEKIRNQYGADYLKDLAVHTPPDMPRIPSYHGQPMEMETDSLIAAIRTALKQLPIPLWQGSNGWVVSGSRTASGLPILANDTHIGFSQPAVWYEAHLEYPGFSFYGHHLAGIPFALLGNNRNTGWGLTMFENDDTDFFLETVNPENKNQVKFKDTWEDVTVHKEVIRVKDENDVVLEIRSTRHGVIVNGALETVPESATPVALSWVLLQRPNHALEAAYRLNHANDFYDAQKAASLFSAPGLNVMYADRYGNIAWWAVASLPIRPPHQQSKLFLDGASGNDEYLGFYSFDKNPQAVNPPWGYVYSANNQPDSVKGVLYPGYYYPKARASRIDELLKEDRKWTVEDMKKMNLDVLSKPHREVAHVLATLLQELDHSSYTEMATVLAQWDGDHQPDDIGPTVYYNLLSQLMFLTMKDELGDVAFKSIMETSVPKNSYENFIRNEQSPWWDDVTTVAKETRRDIVKYAAGNTLKILHRTCGSSPDEWQWGKVHTITHGHPLGTVSLFKPFFNVGPISVAGGSEVLNNLSFSLDTTGYFPVVSGPALRKITDFARIDQGETVSPTGQSGNIMSRYYDDQADMFATGEFRIMMMNRKEIDKGAQHVLILKAK